VSRAQPHSSVSAKRYYQKKRAAEATAASRASYDGATAVPVLDGGRRERPGDGGGDGTAKRQRVGDDAMVRC
jgi:hypothetical protein